MTAADLTPYFSHFLASKLHQSLLPNLKKFSATFRIELTGAEPKIWTLSVQHGALESVRSGTFDAQCSFRLAPDVFGAIADGSLGPQRAFFQRQVEIDGEIALGLRLATVLADFFRRFPWSAHAGV